MIRTTQNSFTKGELDPTLLSRDDVDLYTKGARKMRNMFSLWTGAARIAPGTIYVDTITDLTAAPPAPITNYLNLKGVDFEYDADNQIIYTIIMRPDTTSTVALDIFYDDALVASVAANMYTVAQIKEVFFCVGQDRVLLMHESIQTRSLVRGSNHATWTLSTFAFSTKPVFDFTVLGGTQYRVAGFTFTPSATTGTGVTLTASGAIYTANHVGGLFIGGGGIARITAVASTTSCTITVLEDFTSTAAILGTDASLNEVMWTSGGGVPAGANRGWPARGIFYLSRLAMGRSASLKNVLAFSTTGVYDDFNDSDVDDTAGFSFTLNYKGNETLQDFAGDDAIIFLGASTLYATNPFTENTLTVSDFYAPPQGGEGSSYIPASDIDNQIFHCSPDRTDIVKVFYDTAKAKLNSHPAALLSNHLIETVNSLTAWFPPNIAAKLLLATQENGSMLIHSTLDDEIVSAWSLRTTRGLFRQVISEKDECHVLVEREINLGATYENNANYVFNTDTTMTGFQDISSLVDNNTDLVTIFSEDNTYLLIGHEMPYTLVRFTLDTVASSNVGLTFEYLDQNGQWNTFSPTDGTTGMTGAGNVSWGFDDVPDWAPNDIWDTQELIEQQYWIRLRRTTNTVTTDPILNEINLNLGTRIYLEHVDMTTYMDSQINKSSSSTGAVTGLDHLAGEQVYAIVAGNTTGPFFVEDDGTTNVGEEYSSVDIGVQYKPTLIPMPVFAATAEGNNMYNERYLKEIFIDYYESLYLVASSKNIPVMKLGSYTLDSTVPPQSGFFRIMPMGSWEPRQEIVISQSIPGPMTIRGVGYNVEIS